MPNPRITSIINIHYETFDDSATSFTHTKSEEFNYRDEPFVKNFDVVFETPRKWTRLNFAWLQNISLSYIAVKNISVPVFDVNPSPEELAEINGRIALVHLGSPDHVSETSLQKLLPNRCLVLSPNSPDFEVWVSSDVPNVKLRVWAFPGNV